MIDGYLYKKQWRILEGECDERMTQNSAFPLLFSVHLINGLNNEYYHGIPPPNLGELSNHFRGCKTLCISINLYTFLS